MRKTTQTLGKTAGVTKINSTKWFVNLITKAEVLEMIPISTRTLDRYLDAGKLRGYKLDGKIVFNPDDIVAFLRRRAIGGGPTAPLVVDVVRD
jgi:hypothetical protein